MLVVWSPIDQRTYSSASSRALIRGMPAVHWLWGPSRAALYKDKGSRRGTRSKDRRTTVPRKTLDSTRSEKGAKARGFAHIAVVVDSAASTATSSPLYSDLHSSAMAGGSRYKQGISRWLRTSLTRSTPRWCLRIYQVKIVPEIFKKLSRKRLCKFVNYLISSIYMKVNQRLRTNERSSAHFCLEPVYKLYIGKIKQCSS